MRRSVTAWTRSTAPPNQRPRARSSGCLGGPAVAPAWPQAPPGTTRAPPMELGRRSNLRFYLVGATGFEPVTSSVSAKPREPLCYPPFPQVGSNRRCERETLSCRQGKRSLSNLLPTLGHHYIMPSSCGYAATARWRRKHSAAVQRAGGCRALRHRWLCDVDFGHGFWTPAEHSSAGSGGCRRNEAGFGQPTCDPKGFKAARCDLFRASNRRLTPCQPAFSQVDLDSQGKVRWRAEGPRDGYVGAEAWVASRVDARPFLG
jgi:hypothetical protein